MAQVDHWEGISGHAFPHPPPPEVKEDPSVASWLRGRLASHETAWHFFHRIRAEGLTTGVPFLDQQRGRSALRPGQIVEVSGPSGSAKSEVLLQIAASSALQSQLALRKSTQSGVESELASSWSVYFLDLDLKFDARRLQTIVRDRVRALAAQGAALLPPEEDSLVSRCMDAVRVLRCPTSLDFITGLRAIEHDLEKGDQRQVAGTSSKPSACLPLILVDSIGASYWMDRAVLRDPTQKNGFGAALPLSLVSETVAAQLQRLVHRHRALVVAAKTQLFRVHHRAQHRHQQYRITEQAGAGAGAERDPDPLGGVPELPQWREHMPRAWKDCVMQRLQLGATVSSSRGGPAEPVFMAQWDAGGQAHKEGDNSNDGRSPVCFTVRDGLIAMA